MFTLQTLPGCEEAFEGGACKVVGFSLHAGVAAQADQRQTLEREFSACLDGDMRFPLSERMHAHLGAVGGEIWVNRPGGVAHSGCCLLLPAQTWLRLAKLLLDDGLAGDTRLLPEGYVAEMRTGSPIYPRYGLGVYLQGDYVERRAFANTERLAELRTTGVLHSAPFMADDLFMFDGNANQVVYVVPSQRLIILRTGFNPPRDLEWDNSFLPNLLLEAMATR